MFKSIDSFLRRCLMVAMLTSAPVAWAADSTPTVEKCGAELGTLAVVEPQSSTMAGLGRYGLGSPSTLLRMLAQESGCFAVVERGVAMQNLRQERALADGGQLQAGSNIGAGQMQGADFVLTPSVQFSDDTGGVGGVVGGLLGRAGGMLGQIGGLAGGVKFKEAETTLLMADVRSGIQVASAEGNATKMNFSLGGWGWGGLGWASAGGYSKTPEGKLIAASLLDNYNKIVLAIRDKKSLIRTSVQASTNNAARSTPVTGTTAPAPIAVLESNAPVPQLRGGALPAAMVGAFSGQYAGAEQGIFSVSIEADGQISGVGQSASNVTFNIVGTANPNGAMVMNSVGQAGAAQFTGLINPRSGTVIGTWRIGGTSGRGTFNGVRQ